MQKSDLKMCQSTIYLQSTPTLEYVAIPLGSSSAAPVTNPGPKIFNVFHNHPAAFGEVGTGAEVSDSPITVAGTCSIPASQSLEGSFDERGNKVR
jgi:hypothetical protein